MRSFVVIKSRSIKIFVAMLAVVILLTISFGGVQLAEVFFGYSTRKVPIYSVETDKKQVAISFDAAWGADKTKDIVAVLKEYDVNATFFLVGFWVDENEDLVKMLADDGIEIGTHSENHPDMVKLDGETMKSELVSSTEKIEKLTGKKVELFRAPFGSYNDELISKADELGLKTIQWDVDTLDWKGLTASQMCARVMDNVKNGSIILMHNNSDNIIDGLKLILERLTLQGYEITSVGELIYQDNFEIDRNGVQHNLGQ